MFQSIVDATSIPVLEQVAGFAQARHAVLAGNIANLDTPGYRVRDLSVGDFQARLKQAIEKKRAPQPTMTGSPGEIPVREKEHLAKVSEDPKTILYHDDSNVAVEHQVTEMVKNQMLHNTALVIMASQFQLLQVAISERL